MPTTASDVPTSSSDLSQGLVGAAIAVTAWSAGSVLAKGIDMPPLAIGVYRFSIFSVLLVVFMQVRRTPFRWEIIRHSAFGGIALGADVALFFSAIKITTVVNATLIGALQPIVVGIVAAVVFGETIRRADALWSLVAIAGVCAVVLASEGSPEWSLKGDLLALGATICWSGYFIASKESKKRLTPLEFTVGVSIWTAVIMFPLALLFGQDLSLPTRSNWLGLIAMILTAGIVGHILMNWSLVRIPLWVGSTFTLLIPIAAALLAWAFLDEPLTLAQGLPVIVVIGALAAIVRGQATASKEASNVDPHEDSTLTVSQDAAADE